MEAVVLGGLLLAGVLAWRQAIIVALVLAVFEGAIRKWLLPGSQEAVYFAKDALLLGAYLSFYGARLRRRERLFMPHPANAALGLLLVWSAIQLANPLLPNLGVGLFGVRAYLGYVPLTFMVPSLLRDGRSVARFRTGLLLVAAIPLALGPIQFARPDDPLLNRYAWDPEAGLGAAGLALGYVRITSTFSYISGFATFLTLLVLVAIALLLFARSRRDRLVLSAVLAATIANLFMTGSRGPFLLLAAATPLMVLLAARESTAGRRSASTDLAQVASSAPGRQRARSQTTRWAVPGRGPQLGLPGTMAPGGRRIGALVATMALLLGAWLLAGVLYPEAQAAFFARAESNDDVPDRLGGILTVPLWALGEAGAMGYGIGATHQAAQFLIPAGYTGPLPPGAEGEWERMILEIGPFGFVLVLVARVLVVAQLWRATRAARSTELEPFLVAALVFTLSSVQGPLVFNQLASLLFWFMAGFGLLAPAGLVAATGEAPPRPRPGLALGLTAPIRTAPMAGMHAPTGQSDTGRDGARVKVALLIPLLSEFTARHASVSMPEVRTVVLGEPGCGHACVAACVRSAPRPFTRPHWGYLERGGVVSAQRALTVRSYVR